MDVSGICKVFGQNWLKSNLIIELLSHSRMICLFVMKLNATAGDINKDGSLFLNDSKCTLLNLANSRWMNLHVK